MGMCFPLRLTLPLLVAGLMCLPGDIRSATLIGHWAFDEAAGDTAQDGSALHNAGLIHDAARVSVGIRGGALAFDGSSSHVQIPHLAAYNDTGGISVEAWIRMEPEQAWTYPCVLDKSHRGPDEPPFNTGYALQDPGNRTLSFAVCGGSSCSWATSGTAVNDGTWHFVAGTISAEESLLRFYLDGVLTEESPFSGPIGVNDGDMFIGRHYLLGRYFAGLIDEVKVFSGALTPAEVEDHYRDVIGAELVGWWAFDETAGVTAIDGSLQANDGVIHDAVRVSGGIRGGALFFDGSSSFVQVPDLPAFNDTGGVSVEAWIRMESEQPWDQPCVLDKSHRGPDEPPLYTGYALQDQGDRSLAFAVCGDTSCREASSGAATNDGAWHFVAGTISTQGSLLRFYLDGVMTDEVPFAGPLGVNGGDLFIGRHYLVGRYFHGLIDEVKVFRGALTPKLVQAHFQEVQLSPVDNGSLPFPCLSLHQNVPNPFNPRTVIRYDLPAASAVDLRVFDLAGRRVRTLRAGQLESAGPHEAVWDGRDDRGLPASAGTYVYRLSTGRGSWARKMVLAK